MEVSPTEMQSYRTVNSIIIAYASGICAAVLKRNTTFSSQSCFIYANASA